MLLYKSNLLRIPVSAQDEVAVIYQEWQALLSSHSQPGVALRVSTFLSVLHMFLLEHDYGGGEGRRANLVESLHSTGQ